MRFDCIHCRKATTKPQSVKGAFLRMLTSIFTQQLKLMIMEIVNIEAGAFMEMNNILFKIEKQLKGLNSSNPDLSEWLDNQEVCILMNISDRKLLSLRQKGLIPFSRIDRKIYYKKEDILNYMRRNLKTYTNNGNGTAGIE